MGAASWARGGGGGTSTAPGAGGLSNQAFRSGAPGVGSAGGAGSSVDVASCSGSPGAGGGGGGAGYFGGGGGASDLCTSASKGAGGGGGSGFVRTTSVLVSSLAPDVQTGNGRVVIQQVEAPPAVWTGSGPGTTSVVSDGSATAPQFQYALSGPSVFSAQTWRFSTTTNASGPITLGYDYRGYHAFYQVRVFLRAFVTHNGTTTSTTLLSNGPVNCCTPPSGGFGYTGTTTVNVQPGDTYGFEFGGSNGDSDSRLQGTLTVTTPTPGAAPRLGRQQTRRPTRQRDQGLQQHPVVPNGPATARRGDTLPDTGQARFEPGVLTWDDLRYDPTQPDERSGVGPVDVARSTSTRQVPTFCALCVSRCGALATITDGALVALGPDPSHPTGKALCVKGKAAPEIVSHAERLLYPLKRSNPKGAEDPGWQRISWDEALDTVAARLLALARDHGPECVVFGTASPSTSAMSDSVDWLMRLKRAFGSPNLCTYMELCGWGRYLVSLYTYGASVPGAYMPDLDHAGCILYWGYNPSVARLAHATSTVAALRRGARLVVVDPRRAGLANKADHWLRVRPGTDAALALSLTHVMIEHGWFDDDFVRCWTNGPLLVRADTGRLVRGSDLSRGGDPAHYVVWDEVGAEPVAYDPAAGRHAVDETRLALFGGYEVATTSGPVTCRPAFDLVADGCRRMEPAVAEAITGVPAADIEQTARTLWESRPVAFYTWSGLEQHSNTTQTVRAINQLYALTGDFDAPGGNVLFPSVPSNPIDGADLLAPEQRAKAIGVSHRPLGPARFEFVTGEDFYAAALEGRPYRARGLVNFGANLMMAHGDSARGREALAALDFFVHADLFMNPTAEQADLVLPVASAFETQALKIGFEISENAQSLVQLRAPLVPPRGQARSDLDIIFALATRLGVGEHFWDGDIDAALGHQLAPSGITLEQLRAEPAGVRVPLTTRHRKYAELDGGAPRGFRTPSRKIELYSEVLIDHGYPPLPEFEEPRTSPRSRPDLAQRFPLVLTCAKSLWFCETQHRNVASLRSRVPDPQVELHPDTARERGIAADEWVRLETPHGSVLARAKLNPSLDPQVVCGQHGWWQACPELNLPGYPPLGPGTANLNAVLRQQPSDPISGSSPLRASVCNVSPIAPAQTTDAPAPVGPTI